MTTIADIALPNRLAYLAQASTFHKIFGVPLKQFWEGNLTGLDVIAFDRFIDPEPKESARDAIVRKFGEDAWKCIAALLPGIKA